MKKPLRFLALVAMLCIPWVTQAQDLADYTFSTGVDDAQWIELSGSATTIVNSGQDDGFSSLTAIGFSFPFGDNVYTQFWANSNGIFSFSGSPNGNYNNQFNASNIANNNPKICGITRDMSTGSDGYVKYELTGAAPNRVLVCEFKLASTYSTSNAAGVNWQIQLYESDSRVVIVYGDVPASAPSSFQIGLSQSSTDLWTIDPSTPAATHATAGVSTTYSVWPGAGCYYQFERPVISCPKPTGVTLLSVSSSNVRVSWTAGGSETAWDIYCTDDVADVPDAGTTPTVGNTPNNTNPAVNGLAANRHYYLYVRARCDGDERSEWTNALQFTTLCDAISSVDYEENFDALSPGNNVLPDCWRYINASTNSTNNIYPKVVSSNANSSPNSLYLYSYYSSYGSYDPQPEYAILPPMDDLAGMKVTLSARGYNTSSTFKIGTMSDPADASTFAPITEQTGLTTSHQEFEFFVPALCTDNHLVIMIDAANSGRTYNGVYFDDITITTPPACIPPTGLAATLTPGNGTVATLNWTVVGTETDWVVEYGTRSDFSDAVSEDVSGGTPTLDLTGLTAEAIYYARVKADCGSNGQSEWSATCTFNPTAKTVIGSGDATSNDVPANNYFGYSLTQQIYTAAELGAAGDILSIDFYKAATTEMEKVLDIYIVSTTKTAFADGSDWIPVTAADLVYSGTVTFADNAWTTIDLDSPFSYDGTSNIAIVVDNNTGGYVSNTPFLVFTGSGNQAIYKRSDTQNDDPTGTPGSGSVMTNKNQIRILKTDPPTCPKPTALTAGSVTNNSATLTWTESGSATDWVVEYGTASDFTGALSENVSGTPSLDIDVLLGNTTYYFRVKADCGGGDESDWATKSFTTLCDAYTVPYSYGFEAADDMVCWTEVDCEYDNTNGMSGIVIIDPNEYARTGDGCFFYSSYNGSTDPQYLISPELSGITNGLHVEFFYRAIENGDSYTETFMVGYSTTDNATGSFTWGSEFSTSTTTYQRFSANYPASTKYVAIKYTGADNYYLIIDDILFEEAASCLEPTVVEVSGETTTGATVTWTNGGEETTWDLYVTSDNTDVPDELTTPTNNTTTKPYALTTLTPATTYYVYVRAVCDGSNSSAWSSPATFNTECEAMDLPYAYGFESALLPVCWGTIGTNAYNMVRLSTSEYHNGAKCLNFLRGSGSGDIYAVLPEVDDSYDLTEYEITFWSKGTINFQFGIMTDPTDDETFVAQGDAIVATGSYEQHTVRFLGYSGAGHYIAIKSAAGSMGSSYIDDIEVNHIPACFETSTPAVGAVTNHTAALTWTTDVASASYNIDYRTAAYTNPISLNADFTGLTSGIPTGWNNDEGTTTTATAKWNYYNSGHDAAPCVRFNSYSNSNGNTNFLMTPAMDFAAGNTMLLSFWWKNPTGGDFSVYVSTDGGTTKTEIATALTSQSTWKQETINLTDVVGDGASNVTIHFKGTSNYGNGDAYIYLDEVQVGIEVAAGAWQHETSDALSVTLTGLLASTPYEVKVQGNCGGDGTSEWSDLATFTTDIACPAPTTLAYAELKSNQVDLTWTETGTTGEWVVAYKADADADFTEVPADGALIEGSNISFTLTGLTPEVHYTVKVKANCTASSDGYSEWSNEVTFTTLESCAQPTAVAASNITNNSATISWTGDAEFTLRYRVAASIDATSGLEEDFTTAVPPTDWTKLQGLVDDAVAGTAPTSGGSWTSKTTAFGNANAALNIYGANCKSWLVTPEITLPDGAVMGFDLALTDYGNSNVIENLTAQADDRFAVVIYADDAWTILREWNNSGSLDVYNNIATTGQYVNIDLSAYGTKTVKIAFYGESTVTGNGDNDIHIDNVVIGVPEAAGSWEEEDVSTATSYNVTGLTAETKYEVQVKALCGTNPFSDPYFFTTLYGKTVDIAANTWYVISSPVHNSGTYETFGGVTNLTSGTYDLLRWDQSNGKWETSKPAVFTSFDRGRGYIYRRSDATTLTFLGESNHGDYSSNYLYASCSDANLKGFNLMGNPYTLPYTPAVDYYKLNTNGTWAANTAGNGSVAVAEGFFVKVASTGYFNFTEPSGAKGAGSIAATTLAFTVSNDEFTDIAYARFGAGEGLPKFAHLNPAAPALSIPQEDRHYAIANLSESVESFPLAFSGTGEYTLTVDNTSAYGYLHLIDHATGADIDLLRTASYTFQAAGSDADRFLVKLSPDNNENTFVRISGDRIIVDGTGELEVYDVMGRQLFNTEIRNSNFEIQNSIFPSAGVYVLRLNGNSQKIVVK